MSIDQLLRLFALAFPGDGGDSAPTAGSIARINRELGIILPASFVEFAERCPAYTSLFASIGEDLNSGYHILDVNREFHCDEPHYSVPKWFVVFNHGHDQDCDGFDSRRVGVDGEYPVMYWSALEGLTFNNAAWPVYSRFLDYLEFTLSYYARTTDRERAEKIIHST